MDRAGEEVRGEVYGHVPGAPTPQAVGTQYFAMDVDEVPAAGGSKPDRVAPVSGPQERVQRHFVEQLVEPVCGASSRCSCAADGGTHGGCPIDH